MKATRPTRLGRRGHRWIVRLAPGLLALVLLEACSKTPAPGPPSATAPRVSEISVGRSLNSDKTIADKTDSFRPQDTFYVSIKTEGSAPSASLHAKWTYGDGQPVSEATQVIAPTGVEITEFHAEKPDGWPTGDYKVEVRLNGALAETHEFKVE